MKDPHLLKLGEFFMKKKLGDKRKKEQVKPDDWNVMVCTPAYDGKVDTNYSQSLAEAAFCAPLFGVKLTASVMGNGAFIDLARNIFVKMFLEDHKECTHLFFIDADLQFPSSAFIGLIRSGHDICAGVYPRRQSPQDFPCRFKEHESGGMWEVDDWVMCDRVPTGFLCISRKVVEEMAADADKLIIHGQKGPVPRLFYTRVEGDHFIGEDYCFCDDYVKKYNKPIPVWGNIDFIHGGYEGNLQEHLEERIKELDEDKIHAVDKKGVSAA